jgi:hypothetical protein
MATQYGPSISSPPLRHTILALCASLLPQAQFGEAFIYHKAHSCGALSQRLRHPSTIDEADVLAAVLLTQIGASGDLVELSYHAYGCLKMLNVLSENFKGRPVSEARAVFEPYARQVADYYAIISSAAPGAREAIPQRQTTFSQRVRFWSAVHHFKHISEKWLSASLRAINEVLRDLINLILSCIGRVAQRQIRGYTEAGPQVTEILSYIEGELGDFGFEKALEDLGRLLQLSPLEESNLNGQMMTFQFLKLSCANMGITILRAPSLKEGLERPNLKAGAWIKSYRSYITRGGECHDLYGESNCVLLAGLALREGDIAEGNDGFWSRLLMSQLVNGLLKSFAYWERWGRQPI